MQLEYGQGDILEADILLRIYENSGGFFEIEEEHKEYLAKIGRSGFDCFVHPFYKKEVYRGMLYQYKDRHKYLEHIILLDFGEELLPELLYEMAQNRNYLSIFTQKPQVYETVLAKIEQDFGLVGMVFTRQKEFVRYLKQMPGEVPALVATGGCEDNAEENTVHVVKSKSSLLYQLPKKSFIMDFHLNELFCSYILKKRMNFTYVSIPICILVNDVRP